MIIAFLLRQLSQMPTMESGNECIALLQCGVVLKVCCALYFNLYAGFVYVLYFLDHFRRTPHWCVFKNR